MTIYILTLNSYNLFTISKKIKKKTMIYIMVKIMFFGLLRRL